MLRSERSTKEGGIFPLQAELREQSCGVRPRRSALNKGRGNIPPSRTARTFDVSGTRQRSLNKGRGNIPPSSRLVVQTATGLSSIDIAQQRKGEYSPFKAPGADADTRGRHVSPLNKGRGNIPPSSSPCSRLVSSRSPTSSLNKGRGNIPPSRSVNNRRNSRLSLLATAQQRKGEYSPFKVAAAGVSQVARWQPLNKGRGNIPPSSSQNGVASHRHRRCLNAQQRKGEYSPFKHGCDAFEADHTSCRPTLNKGRGNIPPSSRSFFVRH